MELGQGLAPAGDRNGDGFGDVLLGAPGPELRPEARARRRVRAVRLPDAGRRPAVGPGRSPASRWTVRRPRASLATPWPAPGAGSSPARRDAAAAAPGSSRGAAPRSRQPAPLVTDGPPAWPSPGPRGRARLWPRRERALLYSRRGRLLVTYRDLRPGRETPIAVAAAGRDLLLGSLGANRAYIVPAEAGRSAAPRTRSAAAGRRRSAWRARRRRRCDRPVTVRSSTSQNLDAAVRRARARADPANHQTERDRHRGGDPEAAASTEHADGGHAHCPGEAPHPDRA